MHSMRSFIDISYCIHTDFNKLNQTLFFNILFGNNNNMSKNQTLYLPVIEHRQNQNILWPSMKR